MYRESQERVMTQIKIFVDRTSEMESFEMKVNDFLKENEGKIQVRDIKYTAESPNPNNPVWKNWTALVIYETK